MHDQALRTMSTHYKLISGASRARGCADGRPVAGASPTQERYLAAIQLVCSQLAPPKSQQMSRAMALCLFVLLAIVCSRMDASSGP